MWRGRWSRAKQQGRGSFLVRWRPWWPRRVSSLVLRLYHKGISYPQSGEFSRAQNLARETTSGISRQLERLSLYKAAPMGLSQRSWQPWKASYPAECLRMQAHAIGLLAGRSESGGSAPEAGEDGYNVEEWVDRGNSSGSTSDRCEPQPWPMLALRSAPRLRILDMPPCHHAL